MKIGLSKPNLIKRKELEVTGDPIRVSEDEICRTAEDFGETQQVGPITADDLIDNEARFRPAD